MPCRCYIVPPHLLRGIAESTSNPESIRSAARSSLAAHDRITNVRKGRLESLVTHRGYSIDQHANKCIIPEFMLRHASESERVDEGARASLKKTADHAKDMSARKASRQYNPPQHLFEAASRTTHPGDSAYRAIYDAHHSSSEEDLPGKLVRSEGNEKVKDKAVNEAYDNVGTVLDFYKTIFNWDSIDNKRMDVTSTVHFGEAYENAFWDPEKLQMVFGDGGEFLNNFTGCIDVIGHELTHAVTEHTSPLKYFGQAGALNEHVSDVFGIMVKQRVQDEKSAVADWLIGEDCILPGVKGTALRSMKAPGTAYDDPRFGKDPQVANMKDFQHTFEDNGGVHIYSGIPNRAFYLAAVAFGGYSWEKAGKIWWKTMTSGQVPPSSDFEQFANATVKVAKEQFGEDASSKVRKAWTQVGVLKGGISSKSGDWCRIL